MLSTSSFAILAAVSTALVSGQCLACDATALEGKWTRSIPELGIPDSGTTVNWSYRSGELDVVSELTDDLTLIGGGPYFESEAVYKTRFDARDCTIVGSSSERTLRSFRIFGEPTPDVSVQKEISDRTIRYRIRFSKDRSNATFESADGTAFTMTRK